MIREDLSGFNELLKSKKSKENKCDVCTPNSVHVLWVYGSGGCMVLVVMYFQFQDHKRLSQNSLFNRKAFSDSMLVKSYLTVTMNQKHQLLLVPMLLEVARNTLVNSIVIQIFIKHRTQLSIAYAFKKLKARSTNEFPIIFGHKEYA